MSRIKRSELFKSGWKITYYDGENIDFKVPNKYSSLDKYYNYINQKRDLINYITSNRQLRKLIYEFLKEEENEKTK